MTVALISAEYPPLPGGVGDYTARLAGALAATGRPVRVLTSHAAVRQARAAGHGPPPYVQGATSRWNWAAVPCLVRATADCELVHLQYQTAAYAMHPAINTLPLVLRCLRAGLRVATTFHDLLPPYLFPGAGPARHLPAALLAAASDRVILTAPEAAEAAPLRLLRTLAPRVARRVRLVPIGSNLPEDPPPDYDRAGWRQRLGVAADGVGVHGHTGAYGDTPLLGFFGFQHPSKGLATLWRALALPELREVRVVLIGAAGGASDPTSLRHAARLADLAAELGVERRILRTGFVPADEAAAYLLAVDLCVLPFAEGWSYQRGSLVAALALGVPVLTTTPPHPFVWGTPPTPPEGAEPPLDSPRGNIASKREDVPMATSPPRSPSPLAERGMGGEVTSFPRVVHGTHAWLVPPDDPVALATAARALLDDPQRRAHLGANARELARFFRWERIAEAHRALYAELEGHRG